MSLVAGTRLGPYEIQSAIGAGGMGEVYKARDTRLDRTVAIKVLPAELSADPDRRTRFEREARAVAALSHPHICTLHDIGTHEGTTYLVMEHLAGETLADRLARGPVPLAQALDIGAQIADALDAAHKHGIIHRDLKPGNVMLTTGGSGRSGVTSAKLLDFGLAKLAAHGERPALATGASVPTQAAPVTAQGTILGTLQYMAPEQLEGKEADARTDLWALGAILYEMVSGRRAFGGESQVSLIGNIMNAEPPALVTTQPLTPPALDRVVKKCLAKHPDGRWDTAHDVADELRWASQTSGTSSLTGVQPRRRRWLRTALEVVGGVAMALAGAGAVWLLRPAAPKLSQARVSLDLRPVDELNAGGVDPSYIFTPGGSRTALVWAPDGQALVFVGRRAGIQQLYVRRLDESEARPLAGTGGAQVPAVSADGQWVAFWAGSAIRKVPLSGGPVTDVATGVGQPPRGLIWDASGHMFFGRDDGRIWHIPPDGALAAVTTVGERELNHGLPCPLPGGRVVLYSARAAERAWGNETIVAHTLATGNRKVLLRDAVDARYLPTGHLVFLRRSTLFAVRFDPERVEIQGPPIAVLDSVVQVLTGNYALDLTGAGQFAISPTGTLAWVPGTAATYRDSALVTVDRHGQVAPLPAPMRSYFAAVRLSPDGRRLAVTSPSLTEVGLWLYDLDRGMLTPLARGGEAFWPVWAPDGQRLAFSWIRGGRWSLAAQNVNGAAPPRELVVGTLRPSSWSPDGRQIAVVTPVARGGDIAGVALNDGKAGVQPLFDTPGSYERSPEFSPDGRWLAYASDVSARHEVYIRPYPGPGPSQQVSTDGGDNPAWRSDSKELFFVSLPNATGKRRMMAVDFHTASTRDVGRPTTLFEFDPADLVFDGVPSRGYAVAPDGQRFYVTQARPSPPPRVVTHINLIQNWFEELKAKVPVR